MELFTDSLENVFHELMENWTPAECLQWAKDNLSIVSGMVDPENLLPDQSYERCIARLVWELKIRQSEQESPTKLAVKRVEEYPALPFQSAKFKEAWDAWEVERKEQKRKKYTPRGMRLQFKEFAAMGEERAIAAIYYSIKNRYQGIHEPSGTAKVAPTQSHAEKTLTAAAKAIAKLDGQE